MWEALKHTQVKIKEKEIMKITKYVRETKNNI